MSVYMLIAYVTPSPGRKDYAGLSKARCYICVVASSPDDAISKSTEYINSYGWEIQTVSLIPEEQLLHLPSHAEQVRSRALRYGIAAEFLAASPDFPPGEYPMRKNNDPLH